MVVLGVDSSGHVRNPPIWMVATRRSRKSGQMYHGVHITTQKHRQLENSCKNWADKTSAILIYKAILPIFFELDSIFIDMDFQGKGPIIAGYLKRLLGEKYPKRPALANPLVYFIPALHSPEVKDAHIKTQLMRKNFLTSCEKDPSFKWELEILK